jgi:hypothetical protein
MTVERLQEALNRRPFQPFDIHTDDGEVVRVRSPEFAWVLPPGNRTMYVATGRGVDDDRVEIIDLLLITKLTHGRNGRTRNRRGSSRR